MATLIPARGTCAARMTSGKQRATVRKKQPLEGHFTPRADAITVLTMPVRKGLEFPIAVLPGIGHMATQGEGGHKQARLFDVAATRATQRLVITVSGNGGFGQRLGT